MSYNTDHLRTAGKITVYTTFLGVVVFALIFIFNLGTTEIKEVRAQDTATTSVTVLNTPPSWTASTTEETESSVTNPTNAGDEVAWIGTATDSNGEDYWLLICSGNASPTAQSGYEFADAPICGSGVRWAAATSTSGVQARAATTTASGWAESNNWYAWICDGNSGTPRCNNAFTNGTNATNSSPFIVNHRPTFTFLTDSSPADPGTLVTFYSTSSDPDSAGGQDTVRLFVCATAGFDTSTDTCTGTTLGSTTIPGSAANATATYTIVIPTQDNTYGAFGYVIDNHGFEASGGSQGTDSILTVNNVAPTVSGATISLVQPVTTNMTLTVESAETTGFRLSFVADDNNSCDAVGGGSADEVTDYDLSIYRSGVASTSCAVDNSSHYDPNDCYTSARPASVWNLSCTASTTSCTGSSDTSVLWNCTFPLWYVADPTDGVQGSSTQYGNENWLAQVRAIDDDAATGLSSQSTSGVEVVSFLAFALNTLSIPYGSLEPGSQNTLVHATTTIAATGNVGLDKKVEGDSMCTTYTGLVTCPNSSTSTIPESEQRFATDTVPYLDASTDSLSSTTQKEIEINVPKSTATTSQATADAYWGIRVPGTITFAGDYTGNNTFYAIVGESVDWGP